MEFDYRKKLFQSYASTHVKFIRMDERIQAHLEWYHRYLSENYLTYINPYDRNLTKILEIGCFRGYLLSTLSSLGFKNLSGIDLSPDDIKIAEQIVPDAQLTCIDANHFLDSHKELYDVIILKAVLEHICKNDVMPLLNKLKQHLTPTGIVIVDVPNMDWLFAPHERYMDFSHEIGFTPESLYQVMSNVFSDVKISAVDSVYPSSLKDSIKQKFARFILSKLLYWADPQGASASIWARSIIGVGKR